MQMQTAPKDGWCKDGPLSCLARRRTAFEPTLRHNLGIALPNTTEVVFLSVKRFTPNEEGTEWMKNFAPVQFPAVLDIGGDKVHLKGLCVHSGRTLGSGHWFSWIREGRQWFRHDDLEENPSGPFTEEYMRDNTPLSTGCLFLYERGAVGAQPAPARASAPLSSPAIVLNSPPPQSVPASSPLPSPPPISLAAGASDSLSPARQARPRRLRTASASPQPQAAPKRHRGFDLLEVRTGYTGPYRLHQHTTESVHEFCARMMKLKIEAQLSREDVEALLQNTARSLGTLPHSYPTTLAQMNSCLGLTGKLHERHLRDACQGPVVAGRQMPPTPACCLFPLKLRRSDKCPGCGTSRWKLVNGQLPPVGSKLEKAFPELLVFDAQIILESFFNNAEWVRDRNAFDRDYGVWAGEYLRNECMRLGGDLTKRDATGSYRRVVIQVGSDDARLKKHIKTSAGLVCLRTMDLGPDKRGKLYNCAPLILRPSTALYKKKIPNLLPYYSEFREAMKRWSTPGMPLTLSSGEQVYVHWLLSSGDGPMITKMLGAHGASAYHGDYHRFFTGEQSNGIHYFGYSKPAPQNMQLKGSIPEGCRIRLLCCT
jgi:hypothetical protein